MTSAGTVLRAPLQLGRSALVLGTVTASWGLSPGPGDCHRSVILGAGSAPGALQAFSVISESETHHTCTAQAPREPGHLPLPPLSIQTGPSSALLPAGSGGRTRGLNRQRRPSYLNTDQGIVISGRVTPRNAHSCELPTNASTACEC